MTLSKVANFGSVFIFHYTVNYFNLFLCLHGDIKTKTWLKSRFLLEKNIPNHSFMYSFSEPAFSSLGTQGSIPNQYIIIRKQVKYLQKFQFFNSKWKFSFLNSFWSVAQPCVYYNKQVPLSIFNDNKRTDLTFAIKEILCFYKIKTWSFELNLCLND